MKPILYYAMLMLLLLALQPRLSGQSETRTQANSSRSRGSLMVSNVIDSIQLGNSIAGPGVQLIGCRYFADDSAIGFFRDESFSLGIDSGIVISTGSIFDIPGPNISSSTGSALGMPGDTDLTTLQPNYATLDAAFIELSFIPLSDTLQAGVIIFASEEYPEYVNATFFDPIGIFLDGPGYPNVNIALIPGTSVPIGTQTLNHQTNSAHYISNAGGPSLIFDGYSRPLALKIPVVPFAAYRLKIAIADGGDMAYDSGIFLKMNSLRAYTCEPVASFSHTLNGLNLTITNHSTDAVYYELHLGDGHYYADSNLGVYTHTFADTGTYFVSLLAYHCNRIDVMSQMVYAGTTGREETAEPLAILHSQGDGKFTLGLRNASPGLVQVIDLMGRPVQEDQLFRGDSPVELFLGHLPRSVYLLVVNQDKEREVFRVRN